MQRLKELKRASGGGERVTQRERGRRTSRVQRKNRDNVTERGERGGKGESARERTGRMEGETCILAVPKMFSSGGLNEMEAGV